MEVHTAIKTHNALSRMEILLFNQ